MNTYFIPDWQDGKFPGSRSYTIRRLELNICIGVIDFAEKVVFVVEDLLNCVLCKLEIESSTNKLETNIT